MKPNIFILASLLVLFYSLVATAEASVPKAPAVISKVSSYCSEIYTYFAEANKRSEDSVCWSFEEEQERKGRALYLCRFSKKKFTATLEAPCQEGLTFTPRDNHESYICLSSDEITYNSTDNSCADGYVIDEQWQPGETLAYPDQYGYRCDYTEDTRLYTNTCTAKNAHATAIDGGDFCCVIEN